MILVNWYFFIIGGNYVPSTSDPMLKVRFVLLASRFWHWTARGAEFFNVCELLIPIDCTMFGFVSNTRTSEFRVVVIKLGNGNEASFWMSWSVFGKRSWIVMGLQLKAREW